MNKAGLYSQSGFEFQKLAFIYFSLQMNRLDEVIYEGLDDMEIASQDYPISRYRLASAENKFVQVKSGEINEDILKKVFLNWLLIFSKDKHYVCLIEKNHSVDYKNSKFVDNLIDEVKTTTKKRSSIIRQVKDLYNGQEKKLKDDLDWLIGHTIFEVHSIEELNDLSYQLFESTFTKKDEYDVIKESQFEELIRIVRSKLADKILSRESYALRYRGLLSIISDILARINKNNYDVDFTEFKNNSDKKISLLLSKNGDSVKQLKLITVSNEYLFNYLAEQIFYEDFRSHFLDEANLPKINSLEQLAHSNYKDVLLELSETSDEHNPKRIFMYTTKKELKSELFVEQSSNIKFYSRGCYIHLTDTEIDANLKIKWGEPNESE